MLDTPSPGVAQVSERELRRRIDCSVTRALVDPDYARQLLADPAVVLEGHGCPPQQYRALRAIRATSVRDFARQAQRQFWSVDGAPQSRAPRRPLATAG